MLPKNLKTTSGLSILMHGVISLPDTTSYDKKISEISSEIEISPTPTYTLVVLDITHMAIK